MNYLKKYKTKNTGNLQFLYAKISANLIHFFGNYSLDKHRNILYRYLSHKELIYNRFANPIQHLDSIIPNKEILSKIDTSRIIYSYCIGEYRMIPILLNQLGYDVTILMEERIKHKQADLFLELNNYLNSQSSLIKQKLKFISSQESNVIWKLKSDIINGRKLLVFIDGNSGVNKNHKNLIKSSFFSQDVFLHQGISFLSHSIKTIPYGIVMFYKKSFSFSTFEHKDYTHYDRSTFVLRMTNEIFSNLSSLLTNQEISTWDTLEGVYKWLDIEKLNLENYENGENIFFKNTNIEFNAFRYSPFFLGKDYFIFDKKQYLTYKIQKKDYKKFIKYIEL